MYYEGNAAGGSLLLNQLIAAYTVTANFSQSVIASLGLQGTFFFFLYFLKLFPITFLKKNKNNRIIVCIPS
jgi:hypothetical protein